MTKKKTNQRGPQSHRVMLSLTPEEHAELVKSAGVLAPATWARYLVVTAIRGVAQVKMPKAA